MHARHNAFLENVGFGTMPRFIPTPAPAAADDYSLLLDSLTAASASKSAKQAAFDAALRVENPTRNSPNTTDCASCHAVASVRSHAEDAFGMSSASNANRFTNTKLPLGNTTQGAIHGENIRAFGYVNAQPAIAQRTINESAAVTDWVNANFKL